MEKEKYELYINKNVEFHAELDQTCGAMIYFTVESNKYKGHGPIYLDKIELQSAIKCLSGMVETLDVESLEYYIKINVSDGEVMVEGSIGDYNQHRLWFGFIADQTLLSLLLKVLKKIR